MARLEDCKKSKCRHCKTTIFFDYTIVGEWTHYYGGSYCLTDGGFCNPALNRAEPVLETEVL